MDTNPGRIAVPSRLSRPHPFVAALRETLRGAHRDEQDRLHPPPTPGLVRYAVSRQQTQRALRILQALFVESERRGYIVTDSIDLWSAFRGVAISIRGHQYPVAISELCDREPLTEEVRESWRRENQIRLSYAKEPTHRYIPNGRLKLSFPYYTRGRRSNWTEGPRGSLEEKLVSVFIELESWAAEDDKRDAERAREEEERQRRYEARLEQERLDRIHAARVERLTSQVASWRLASDVREYVAELRRRVVDRSEEGRELQQWVEWSAAWAEESDPLQNLSLVAGLDVKDSGPG